jgi:hypothetical protein
VRFAAPFHPTLDRDLVIDIAALAAPVQASFETQLGKLFQALFAGNSQETLTFQISLAYDYAVNVGLDPITLPVYLLPPAAVDVQGGTAAPLTLSQLITDLAQAARLWFDTNTPQPTEGTLWFVLTVFASLTAQPMPLLRLRRLRLKIEDIVPPLTTG